MPSKITADAARKNSRTVKNSGGSLVLSPVKCQKKTPELYLQTTPTTLVVATEEKAFCRRLPPCTFRRSPAPTLVGTGRGVLLALLKGKVSNVTFSEKDC
jgi:hypothetical protein